MTLSNMVEKSRVAVLCVRLSGVCQRRWEGKPAVEDDDYVVDEALKLFDELLDGAAVFAGHETYWLSPVAALILPTVIEILPDETDVVNEMVGMMSFLHGFKDINDTYDHGFDGVIAFLDKLEAQLAADLDSEHDGA